jgi:catechol 2,3-dioxygenase-like lactoylglutathione lyase family enzyme
MLTGLTHSAVYVTDQDEALAFYVDKLGMEVAADVDLGVMRWLTVRVPGDTTREVLLEVPGPPAHDEATAAEVRALLAKGALGLGFILTVDDCRATYERWSAAGVEFTQEPTEHFYGIDCGVRDPFGNHLRVTQPAPTGAAPPEPAELRAEFNM